MIEHSVHGKFHVKGTVQALLGILYAAGGGGARRVGVI